jgi:NAD(P)H dehydrogenase (quinone)
VNVLIVYAHPEPKSFNGAMKDVAAETLRGAGHKVAISDLYAMDFDPVVGPADFTGERADPDFFSVQKEQTRAFETGSFVPSIAAEIEKLKHADLVIFQFPIWWFSMPAILKGWTERVFARGFAYLPDRKYDTGIFRGKAAMVAATTGTPAESYAPDGIYGDILMALWPLHNGLLRYCGFDVLTPFIAYMPRRVGQAGRDAYLEEYRKRLLALDSIPRLFFHPVDDYGPTERLKPGVAARSSVRRNV